MRLTLLALFILLRLSAGHAATPTGIWEGKVSQLPAVACFNEDGAGAYYYLRNDDVLMLVAETPGHWREQNPGNKKLTGRWVLESVQEDRLEGEWHTLSGSSPTPIRLSRLTSGSPTTQAAPCSDKAWISPRLHSMKKTGSGQASGLRWNSVSSPQGTISGARLVEKNATPLGRALEARLEEAFFNRFSCAEGVSEREDNERSFWNYTSAERILHISPGFLVLSWSNAYDCGGAHPDSGSGAVTLDRASGKQLDTALWLKSPYDKKITTASPLGKHLALAYRKASPDCQEALEQNFGWNYWPTPAGMVFQPMLAHVAMGCVEDHALSWLRLAPYLSKAGQRVMREFAAP